MKFKQYWNVLKQAISDYSDDKVPRLSAALAYYTMLSIAPLLIILIAIVGFIFGKQAAEGQLVGYLEQFVGPTGALAMQEMIANASVGGGGIFATLISVVVLLFGATGVFAELQDDLNTVWEVKPKPGRAMWDVFRSRLLSLAMLLVIAFLLLVSLVLSAVLTGMSNYLARLMPGLQFLLPVVDIVVNVGVITVLFAMIFKYLPDVNIHWRDVWLGGFITAVLFTIGKYLLALYLSRGGVSSVYGAAGSLVALLIWVYYSSQILFFGAEVTQAYARVQGRHIPPARYAMKVTAEDETRVRPQAQPSAAPVAPRGRRRRWVPLLIGLAIGRVLGRMRRQNIRRAVSTRRDGQRLAQIERALI